MIQSIITRTKIYPAELIVWSEQNNSNIPKLIIVVKCMYDSMAHS